MEETRGLRTQRLTHTAPPLSLCRFVASSLRRYFLPFSLFEITTASPTFAFFDASVRTYSTRDCQVGFNPDAPNGPTIYQYNPSTGFVGYDPPTLSGAASDLVRGYYRWTKNGLQGYDYIKGTGR